MFRLCRFTRFDKDTKSANKRQSTRKMFLTMQCVTWYVDICGAIGAIDNTACKICCILCMNKFADHFKGLNVQNLALWNVIRSRSVKDLDDKNTRFVPNCKNTLTVPKIRQSFKPCPVSWFHGSRLQRKEETSIFSGQKMMPAWEFWSLPQSLVKCNEQQQVLTQRL